MSEQGPYTLIESDSYPTRIEGPNLPKVIGQPITMRMLKMLLNAAYSAGRLSASEQGKELILAGDAMATAITNIYMPGRLEVDDQRQLVEATKDWDRAKAKTAGEQPSQSSTEGLGDAASGPGASAVAVAPSLRDQGLQPPIAELTEEQLRELRRGPITLMPPANAWIPVEFGKYPLVGEQVMFPAVHNDPAWTRFGEWRGDGWLQIDDDGNRHRLPTNHHRFYMPLPSPPPTQ